MLLDKVYGTTEGSCAWCFTPSATKSYVGTMTNGEVVEYQVCLSCYEERV
jgi:hypothetical protein